MNIQPIPFDHPDAVEHAALRFFERHGYTPIEVFAPYEAVTYSRFERVFRDCAWNGNRRDQWTTPRRR